ncbi:MAG TPA: hypothetical protein VNT01_01065 [Symbiobacteriaceae bacterium]|nr:hypothetical protein [Symbiobacteriaceae bacterium]
MYELVVKQAQIQKAIPFMMPKNVELFPLSQEEVLQIHRAAAAGELFVRVDTPEGEQVRVTRIWPDPHDPRRITLFLG